MRSWLVGALALVGCTSPVQMKAADLHEIGPTEGRVFGSVLVVVAPLAENESSWAWTQGRKASGFDYSLLLEKYKEGLFDLGGEERSIRVEPGKEEGFALKLEQGRYLFTKLKQEGFSNLEMGLGASFEVTPGKTTYVGRIVIELPARMALFSQGTARIEDARATAADLLGAEYAPILVDASSALMSL